MIWLCRLGWHNFKEYRSKPEYLRFVCKWCGVTDFRANLCKYKVRDDTGTHRCQFPPHRGNVHKIEPRRR